MTKWIETAGGIQKQVECTVEDVAKIKIERIEAIRSKYQNQRDVFVSSIASATEKDTWTKQEVESRAWSADNTVATPLIDSIMAGRNLAETKAEFVAKILYKADLFSQYIGMSLGAEQAEIKAVEMSNE